MINMSDSLKATIIIFRRKLLIFFLVDRINWMFVLLHQIPEESDEKQFAFGEKRKKS